MVTGWCTSTTADAEPRAPVGPTASNTGGNTRSVGGLTGNANTGELAADCNPTAFLQPTVKNKLDKSPGNDDGGIRAVVPSVMPTDRHGYTSPRLGAVPAHTKYSCSSVSGSTKLAHRTAHTSPDTRCAHTNDGCGGVVSSCGSHDESSCSGPISANRNRNSTTHLVAHHVGCGNGRKKMPTFTFLNSTHANTRMPRRRENASGTTRSSRVTHVCKPSSGFSATSIVGPSSKCTSVVRTDTSSSTIHRDTLAPSPSSTRLWVVAVACAASGNKHAMPPRSSP